jgi:hypothetical protein
MRTVQRFISNFAALAKAVATVLAGAGAWTSGQAVGLAVKDWDAKLKEVHFSADLNLGKRSRTWWQ